MSKCKSCGAAIIWIKTAGGKLMPCNPQKISYRNDWSEGGLTLITPDGKIAKEVVGTLNKPYFYSVFLLNENSKSFDSLNDLELLQTYRLKTLSKVIKHIN